MIYVLSSFLKKSIILFNLMQHRGSNQRRGVCGLRLISTPPFLADTPSLQQLPTPQLRDQYHKAPGSTGDSCACQTDCRPPCPPHSILIFFVPSHSSLQSLSHLYTQQDAPPSGHRQQCYQCQAFKTLDESVTTIQRRKDARRGTIEAVEEREELKKGVFGLVDRSCLRFLRGLARGLLMLIMEQL